MTGWRMWPTSQRSTVPEPEVVDAIREVRSNMTAEGQHECIRPSADNWHPGIMWACLRCGDVWIFVHRGRWARTDVNLHSFRQRLAVPEGIGYSEPPPEPAPEPEYGVRIFNGGNVVDMRTQDRASAEELVNYTNRVSSESRAEMLTRWPNGQWQTQAEVNQAEQAQQPSQPPYPNDDVFTPQQWFGPNGGNTPNGYMQQQAPARA